MKNNWAPQAKTQITLSPVSAIEPENSNLQINVEQQKVGDRIFEHLTQAKITFQDLKSPNNTNSNFHTGAGLLENEDLYLSNITHLLPPSNQPHKVLSHNNSPKGSFWNDSRIGKSPSNQTFFKPNVTPSLIYSPHQQKSAQRQSNNITKTYFHQQSSRLVKGLSPTAAYQNNPQSLLTG